MVKNKTSIIKKLMISGILFSTVVYPLNTDVASAEVNFDTKTTKEGFIYFINDEGTISISGYSKKSTGIKIEIPTKIENKSVTEIADFAFNKKGISSVKIPEGVFYIGESAFASNQLNEVTFPKTLVEIGEDSFRANTLKKIKFSTGLVKIGDRAFQANLLTNFDLPDSVTDIGEAIFNYNVGAEGTEGEDSKPEIGEDGKLTYYESDKIKVDITNPNGNLSNGLSSGNNTTKPTDKENEESLDLGLVGGELILNTPLLSSTKLEAIKVGKETTEATAMFNGDFTVSDLRATGEGWHLTIQASPFTQVPVKGGIPPKGGWYKFPTGSVKITALPTISPVDGKNQSKSPTSLVSLNQGGMVIDGGAVTVVSAYYNEGMGDWRINFPSNAITFSVSNKYAKSDKVNYPNKPTPYASTITWTLVSGPGA